MESCEKEEEGFLLYCFSFVIFKINNFKFFVYLRILSLLRFLEEIGIGFWFSILIETKGDPKIR